MSKFAEIVEGWRALWVSDPSTEQMANERSQKCADCEQLRTAIGGFYLHCAKCGCYIPAKIRSKNSKCPLEKW